MPLQLFHSGILTRFKITEMFVKITLKISCFCFLFLFALEALFRVWIPADTPFLQYPRRTPNAFIRSGWTPYFRGWLNIQGIGGQHGFYELRINPFGFRGRSMRTISKPPHTTRIFFMGGSFVEELSLPENKTFPAIVEKRLTGSTKIRFECINAGISGFMARDLVAQFKYQILL